MRRSGPIKIENPVKRRWHPNMGIWEIAIITSI